MSSIDTPFASIMGIAVPRSLKNNLNATTDPGPDDDIRFGYSVGSKWINDTLDREFVCLGTTENNAVWKETTTESLLNNNTATTPPGVNDDSVSGYAPGSEWTDITAKEFYICLDADVGAAVWEKITNSTELLGLVLTPTEYTPPAVISPFAVDYATNKQLQDLGTISDSFTIVKGTGWPDIGTSAYVILKLVISGTPTITWTAVVDDWTVAAPTAPGTYFVHLQWLFGRMKASVETKL
jgi:hypothetical protein